MKPGRVAPTPPHTATRPDDVDRDGRFQRQVCHRAAHRIKRTGNDRGPVPSSTNVSQAQSFGPAVGEPETHEAERGPWPVARAGSGRDNPEVARRRRIERSGTMVKTPVATHPWKAGAAWERRSVRGIFPDEGPRSTGRGAGYE